ncbi:MAG: PKD domain-containing protein, partial [Candidatus Kariarchaeaceae archaeon]
MVATSTRQRGTAGAFAVIAILLTSMVYNDLSGNFRPLGDLEDDAIFVKDNNVYVGQEVIFYLKPALLSDDYGIDYFMWDFHDGDYIYVSTRDDRSISHIYTTPGEFMVSVMALKGNQSKIFTIPMYVIPAPHDITIKASSSSVDEDVLIIFDASGSQSYTPITNYLWEFGDGETQFGQTTNHSYVEEGVYTVRVRGYTNSSLIYTGFQDITVNNKIPEVKMVASSSEIDEDHVITFTAGVIDSPSDLDSLQYVWDFGDGLMAEGSSVKHMYTQDGTYQVVLTVKDNNGATNNISRNIQVNNEAPIINNLWNFRNYFTEGETVTTFANLTDSQSDLPLLNYYWSIPGDGSEISLPFFETGNHTIDLTLTDDDGTSDSASSDTFEVINANPYASLISAYSTYNITFRIWGELDGTAIDSSANITLFKDGNSTNSLILDNQDAYRNITRPGLVLEGLQQPLNEYWDLLINVSSSEDPFDTYVETTFSFDNHDPVAIINHCTSNASACLSDSYRFPIAPINRGFPITYNFSVFDPGNDLLTLTLNLGSNNYSKSLQSSDFGPSSGNIALSGDLPIGELPSDIYYYVEDGDGGRSPDYQLPLIDYSKLEKPAEFADESTWEYTGHVISHFAPVSEWITAFDYEIDNSYDFMIESFHPDPTSLRYSWKFGNGDTSTQQYASYTYDFKGTYLVWTLVSDDYYEYVTYKMINVSSPVPEYHPTMQGYQTEGETLTFLVSGLPSEMMTDVLQFHWDFGDGTTGYGQKSEHAYTSPGNYTVILTVNDCYNVREITEMEVVIFNAPPFVDVELLRSMEVIEGTNVFYTPNVKDSPYDTLNLDYQWNVNGVTSSSASLWMKTANPENYGELIVNDTNGANYTYEFNFNVTSNPLEMTAPTYYHLYGDPDTMVNIVGTISPSVFEKDTYRSGTTIDYSLYDKSGLLLHTGLGTLNDSFYGYTVPVNTSDIGTDQDFADLEAELNDALDLSDENSPSGNYRIALRLLDENDRVIASTSTTLVITIDKDADFITDELEVLYSKTISYLDFDIHDTDTDDDGQADPVEYILGEDVDGDGLPSFFEDLAGTSDENPDTDGDGLTDGYGPYGEFQLGTDGTKEDTDGDGLIDSQEVIGWEIQLITPKGLVVREVTSSPLHADTDGDGVNDYYEFHLLIDPRTTDTDADGLDDLREQDAGTSLVNKDTDFDGLSDYDEVATNYTATYYDADGLALVQTYYLNPLTPDSDQDNITDYDEALVYGSVGTNKDTDRDGINDYDEIFTYGTKTNDADTDREGLADGIEIAGFEIPIVIISNGVYNETGGVITQPEVRNYTITVTTDPLLMDTDGDGLTDWEELLGDPDNVGDPTSVDSDGDGIIDMWDPQRLISDYTPANITSD